MSDTPRTEEVLRTRPWREGDPIGADPVVALCCQLERELAEAKRVPEGWKLKLEGDTILVSGGPLGFYVAHKHDRDNIASVILFHFANAVLGEAPEPPMDAERYDAFKAPESACPRCGHDHVLGCFAPDGWVPFPESPKE